MVLLEKYYDLIDRPSREVNKVWKGCQILFYVIAALTGLAASYIFGTLRSQFGDNCLLYPNLSFDYVNKSEMDVNATIQPYYRLDLSKTVWGDDQLCDFCQYVPIMSMILATIFITFFFMCPRGGSRESDTGIKRPWHIVPPSILITGIFVIIILISSIKLHEGLLSFCAQFEPVVNTTQCGPEVDSLLNKGSNYNAPVSNYIKTLPVLLSFCVLAWIIAFAILLLRCCCFVIDFKLIEISISSVDKKVSTSEESTVLLDARHNNSSDPISQV